MRRGCSQSRAATWRRFHADMTSVTVTVDGGSILLDQEDLGKFESRSWRINKGYVISRDQPPARIFLHRLLLKAKEGQFVDHKNGNGFDNRKVNLRLCSRQENARNSKKRLLGKAKSIYKGVSWHKGARKWVAFITVDYKFIYLGLFLSEKEAAQRYNDVALMLDDKFFKLNKL